MHHSSRPSPSADRPGPSPTHHPGPPRFVSVGESVELAPRNPRSSVADAFAWTLVDRPNGSEVTVSDGPVVHLEPDEPGSYHLELVAPDDTHEQTVRAFPSDRLTARFAVDAADLPEEFETLSVVGPFNEFRLGHDRPVREDDEYVLELPLPPGEHYAIFAVDDDFEHFERVETTVEGPGRPRVHLDGTVDDDEVVVTATPSPAPDGSDPTVEFHLDGRDDLSRADVAVDDTELRAPVSSLSPTTRVHAVAVAERSGVADTLVLEPGGGQVSTSRPADPPTWARDATMYSVFVRSFAGETVDATFEELERRVPYIESLGVDCLWLTPIVASPTDHGYHVTDFFETAEDLGTRAEFESLVDRCHDAGIRVVFDLVVNHTSRDHPAFQLHSAGVEAYADHYSRVPPERDDTDVDWAGDGAPEFYFNWARIPNVNYDSLAVREWMLDVVDEWSPVVDGFRCDVAWGVPHGFWKEVRDRAKREAPDFLLLDESIPRDPDAHENEFDAHYDTDLYHALREVGRGEAPADAILDALDETARKGFPDPALHMRYVENHDETRYATECDESALGAATAATFTLPGIP